MVNLCSSGSPGVSGVGDGVPGPVVEPVPGVAVGPVDDVDPAGSGVSAVQAAEASRVSAVSFRLVPRPPSSWPL